MKVDEIEKQKNEKLKKLLLDYHLALDKYKSCVSKDWEEAYGVGGGGIIDGFKMMRLHELAREVIFYGRKLVNEIESENDYLENITKTSRIKDMDEQERGQRAQEIREMIEAQIKRHKEKRDGEGIATMQERLQFHKLKEIYSAKIWNKYKGVNLAELTEREIDEEKVLFDMCVNLENRIRALGG